MQLKINKTGLYIKEGFKERCDAWFVRKKERNGLFHQLSLLKLGSGEGE